MKLPGNLLTALHLRNDALTPRSLRRSGGFTLIELLVVIAIIVFISGAILANANRFGTQTTLQSLAYDMALTIRQAQVYGISVKQGSGSNYNAAFGLSFSSGVNSYELFDDAAYTGYFVTGEDVPPSPYTLTKGYSIYKLCLTGSDVGCSLVSLSVMFVRPDPNAWFPSTSASHAPYGDQCGKISGTTVEQCAHSLSAPGVTGARIIIKSPTGDCEQIVVSSNGGISVQPDATCS